MSQEQQQQGQSGAPPNQSPNRQQPPPPNPAPQTPGPRRSTRVAASVQPAAPQSTTMPAASPVAARQTALAVRIASFQNPVPPLPHPQSILSTATMLPRIVINHTTCQSRAQLVAAFRGISNFADMADEAEKFETAMGIWQDQLNESIADIIEVCYQNFGREMQRPENTHRMANLKSAAHTVRRARHRVAEGIRALQARVSPAFFDAIATQMTMSSTILDIWKNDENWIRPDGQRRTPLEMLQAASQMRCRRVAGLEKSAKNRTFHGITPTDFANGLAVNSVDFWDPMLHPAHPHLSIRQWINTQLYVLDSFGIVWATITLRDQHIASYRNNGALTAGGFISSIPPTPSKPIQPTPPTPIQPTLPQPAPGNTKDQGAKGNSRKRDNDPPPPNPGTSSPRQPDTPTPKPRPGPAPGSSQTGPQNDATTPTPVVQPDKRVRVQSPAQKNLLGNIAKFKVLIPDMQIKIGDETNTKTMLQNPIQNPTSGEKALWEIACRKVMTQANSSVLPVTNIQAEVRHAFNNLHELNSAIQRIGAAIAGRLATYRQMGNNDQRFYANIAAYIEGVLDIAYIFVDVSETQYGDPTMIENMAEIMRARIRNDQGTATGSTGAMTIGSLGPGHQRAVITPDEFLSFRLRNNNSSTDGWLNDSAIHAALVAAAENVNHTPTQLASALAAASAGPAATQTHTAPYQRPFYVLNSLEVEAVHQDILDNRQVLPRQITVPAYHTTYQYVMAFHIPDHWLMVTFDLSRQEVVLHDSLDTPMTREMNDLINFVAIRVLGMQPGNFTRQNRHDTRQRNFSDCGVLAIEAGLAFIESRDPRDYTPHLRRMIAEDLHHALQMSGSTAAPGAIDPSINALITSRTQQQPVMSSTSRGNSPPRDQRVRTVSPVRQLSQVASNQAGSRQQSPAAPNQAGSRQQSPAAPNQAGSRQQSPAAPNQAGSRQQSPAAPSQPVSQPATSNSPASTPPQSTQGRSNWRQVPPTNRQLRSSKE